MNKVFKVGLIGCGHIAETYFRAHQYFNNIKIIKCADINLDAAKRCAKTYNIEAVSVGEILEDKEIEIILNLTIPKAHYEIAKRSLEAGKNTYVISIHTDGYQWLEGSAYWESPTLSMPSTEENKKALKDHLEGKNKQRKGV